MRACVLCVRECVLCVREASGVRVRRGGRRLRGRYRNSAKTRLSRLGLRRVGDTELEML